MQQVFDDGSTISYSDDMVSSTAAPNGWLTSDYGGNFTPSAATPGATSWEDVMKNGFGRLVDYGINSLAPQNTAPSLTPEGGRPQPGTTYGTPTGSVFGVSTSTLLIGGVVLVGIALVAAMGRKG